MEKIYCIICGKEMGSYQKDNFQGELVVSVCENKACQNKALNENKKDSISQRRIIRINTT